MRKSTGRKNTAWNWLAKAPRRRKSSVKHVGRYFEPLEPRQMLSANQVDPSLSYGPAQIADFIESHESFNTFATTASAEMASAGPFGNDVTLPIGGDLSQTFSLHSNPASNHTVYLDFTGHRTEDTPWNSDQLVDTDFEGALIDTLPYNFGSDPFDFDDEERLVIQETFLRVSETFAAFNVNITTEQPDDLDDLMRSGDLDERWGIRVVIGGSSLDWYEPLEEEPTASGVAYLNSFSSPIDNPAFVFGEGIDSPNLLTQIIVHEVGHSLGLAHDGILPEPGWDPDAEEPGEDDPPLPEGPVDYYPGHENEVWGPIMGAAFNAAVQQWSIGEYFRADNQEDDLSIIAGPSNGFGYRQDEHGNSVDEATLLTSNEPTTDSILNNELRYDSVSIIERNDDSDVYGFFSAPGEISIKADPALFGPTLDIRLDLYDASGNLLASAAPGASIAEPAAYQLDALLEHTVLLPGMYYVSVSGDGSAGLGQEDEPLLAGYTNYASLGEYSLDITARLGPMPDEYEPNDFQSQAFDAPYGDYTFTPSIHQGGDEDWFKWTAGEDGTLDVDLLFSHDEADLDLAVYAANGNRLRVSGSLSDNEQLSLPVEADTSYFVRVWSPGPSTVFDYVLQWDGPGDPVDEYEENETLETAFELDTTESPDFNLDLSIHRPDDNDFFSWNSPGNGTLEIELEFDHEESNLDVEVWQDGAVIGVAESTDDNELLLVPVVQGGNYQIRVFSSGALLAPGDTMYTMRIDGPEIDEDLFEPNDVMAAAADMSGMTDIITGLSIDAPNDIDIYKWTATATGDLRARAFFFHENGDLDLRMRNSEGQIIAASSSLTDNESVTQRVIKGRDYFVEVYGHEGATQSNYFFQFTFAESMPIPGDFDGNGYVDQLDRGRWALAYGETGDELPTDANGDGVVNAADYTIWRDNQGTGLQPEGAQPIDSTSTIATIQPNVLSQPLSYRPTVRETVAPAIDSWGVGFVNASDVERLSYRSDSRTYFNELPGVSESIRERVLLLRTEASGVFDDEPFVTSQRETSQEAKDEALAHLDDLNAGFERAI